MAEAPIPASNRLAWLWRLLGKLWHLLYQISTLKGIIRGLCAVGVLHLAPAVQDQLASAILTLMGGCQGALAVIDIIRDEHKGKTIITTAPVLVTGPATVETKT